MLIGCAAATWDSGILSYCDYPNVTNADSINRIDVLNTSLTELPNLYDFPNFNKR